MSGVSLKVTGTAEVAASLAKLARLSDDLSPAFDVVGSVIVAEARSRAPKKSGALAGSIHSQTRRFGTTVSTSSIYGGVQEYGWRRRNIRAQPYLRPAADSKAVAAAVAITKQIQRYTKSVGLG